MPPAVMRCTFSTSSNHACRTAGNRQGYSRTLAYSTTDENAHGFVFAAQHVSTLPDNEPAATICSSTEHGPQASGSMRQNHERHGLASPPVQGWRFSRHPRYNLQCCTSTGSLFSPAETVPKGWGPRSPSLMILTASGRLIPHLGNLNRPTNNAATFIKS